MAGRRPDDSLPPPAGPGPDSSDFLKQLRSHAPPERRYAGGEEIARGGMGAILRVWDEDLKRHLAMKVLLPDAERRGDDPGETTLLRFLEEAQVTGQLDHPGVVPVHELGVDERGRAYFTMRLVKGRDLREIFALARHGAEGWSTTRVVGVLLKACEALAYAHSKGVVHRDLKPANIMVGRFGEVYVMDWGLARVSGRPDRQAPRAARADAAPGASGAARSLRTDGESPLRTDDGAVLGTPLYMSPEQARGETELIGPRTDVYAMGAMLYELLAGHAPYVPLGRRPSVSEVLEALLAGPPAPLAEIAPHAPAELRAIVARAMGREPIERYADVERLADDLRAWLEGRVVSAYDRGTVAEAAKWVARNRALVFSSAAALLLGLGWLVSIAVGASARSARLAEQKEVETRAREVAEHAQQSARAAQAEAERVSYESNLRLAALLLRGGRPGEAGARLADCPPGLRGWEWRQLAHQRDPALLRVPRHGRLMRAVALTPDGELLVTEGLQGALRVVEVASGALRTQLEVPGSVTHALAISADGALLASGGTDRRLRVHALPSGALRAEFTGHGRELRALALSADGAVALSAAHESFAIVWDTAAGERLRLDGGGSDVADVALSADGALAATVTADGQLVLHDARLGELRARWRLEDGAVSLALSAEGRWLLVGDAQGGLTLVEARAGAEPRALARLPAAVGDLALAAAGRRAAVALRDGSIVVLDLPGGALVDVLPGEPDWAGEIALDAAGRRVASIADDDAVAVWNLERGDATSVFVPTGRPLEALALDEHARRLFWAGDERLVHAAELAGVADGPALTAAGRRRRLPEPGARSSYEGAQAWNSALACSRDGAWLLAGSQDGRARLWRVPEGAPQATLEGHAGAVAAVAIGASGERLLTGSADRSARLWRVPDGALLAEFVGHERAVRAVAFAPDERLVATGSLDGTARLWEARGGPAVATLTAHRGGVLALAFSPDGRRLVTGSEDGTLIVWGTVRSEVLAECKGHVGAVNAVLVLPDGARIASAGDDGTIAIWDLATGQRLSELRAHVGPVRALAFAADLLASAGADGTLRLWDGR